jgi:uncharacterized protein YyaL (SSP411 family)
MNPRAWTWIVLIPLALTTRALPAAREPGAIVWQDWTDAAFERARREHRFVLLDLEAVWCHWCHVMEATTYRDAEVVALVAARFVPVRVDQDARPDLSNRYEDYGWPATVVLDGDGQEIVKFQGYIPPERMRALLRGIVADPTPGPSVTPRPAPPSSPDATMSVALRGSLEDLFAERYDGERGGWGYTHKFLDGDSVEYALERALAGDLEVMRQARETLTAQRQHLIDPVWGGVYQYSDGGVWTNPHFEKIMSTQAENLRIYSLAYAQWRDPADLEAASDVRRYLRAFLASPEGAFYVSQDADLVHGQHSGDYFALPDAERRRRGIPRVDTHLYTRENGWAASALLALHGATGNTAPLDEARRTADWIVRHRSLAGGGFRHDAVDTAGPYLGDTLAAGRAFLALYAATAERAWLARAADAADFIGRRFKRPGIPGLVTAVTSATADRALPQREENIQAARFANLLFHYTGEARHRELARHALAYLATPDVARRFNTGGVLLADAESRRDPVHVTVVGGRNDPAAAALWRAALGLPTSYKRVELWDPSEPPLPRADVQYPKLARPAAFLCTEGRCSSPAYTPADLSRRAERPS